MNNFQISRLSFSELFWSSIFSNGAAILELAKRNIITKHLEIEALRKFADYNTGSISIAASVGITLVTNYFRPKIVAEVGTFIGRSTYSVALGHSLCNIESPQIHTCDLSNDIPLGSDPLLASVIQYPKKPSTYMLGTLVNQDIVPDMYLIDGRIQNDDIVLLEKLNAKNAVILLDDFEGTEKGVFNARTILKAFKNDFLLIYPPTSWFLKSHGFSESSTTAVLLPKSKLKFVNQD